MDRDDRLSLQKAAQILQRILENTAGKTGVDYFPALASHLAIALGFRTCLITECLNSPPTRVATLAFWDDGSLQDRHVYDLEDTPCCAVIAGQISIHDRHLRQLFPRDKGLDMLKAESYAGVPMYSGDGEVIGHLVVLDTEPFDENRPDLALLQIFAAQASAELERQRANDKLARQKERQRRLERKLLQSQKLEIVGQLAGGIAHDFNNHLTSILGYGDLLLRQLPVDEASHRSCEEVVTAARRAAELTRQLLAFSRRQIVQPRKLDLNKALRDTAQILHRLVHKQATLDLQLAPTAISAFLDPGQLEQVIIMLVMNAREAMPDGGEIILRSGSLEVDESTFEELSVGKYGWLAIGDTGVGIPTMLQERIFEPYFSTKDHAVGLGLSTVDGIVKQHGGAIRVESELDRGTTVTLLFPWFAEVFAPNLPPQKPRVASRRVQTILVAEDQDLVRQLVRRVLEAYGYSVLEAANAKEALDCAARQKSIDLLITDVVMPGESGRELAQKMQVERPDTHVIYMSGHTDEILLRHGIRQGNLAFLQKPFSEKQLIDLVREVLV